MAKNWKRAHDATATRLEFAEQKIADLQTCLGMVRDAKSRWYLNRKIEQLMPSPQADKATLYYLATPYSKYPRGLTAAFEDAANLAARLLQVGFRVYSPIAHTHPLAVYGKIDPLDHAIW